ncbi:unnamed protein product [Urochloa decumbens]|uniref:KIB1-4 beta-propeller domain-containing protein n=1 Tax=Urochloa decumbens TaxID=240449 RepID=A0ABC9B4Y1_9POAL
MHIVRPKTQCFGGSINRARNPNMRRSKRLASSGRWLDLQPDLLRNISSRLHAAADYVRFHAVCTRWRDALPPAPSRPVLLPWLLGPRDSSGRRLARCIFSSKPPNRRRRNTTTTNAGLCVVQDRKWVIRTDDGTVAGMLPTTTTTCPQSSSSSTGFLADELFAGTATTPMPCYPDEVNADGDRRAGAISGDGTIFVYSIGEVYLKFYLPTFRAALLHPGDAEWTPVRSRQEVHVCCHERASCSVAYHGRKILMCKGNFCGCIVTDDVTRARDVLRIWDPQEPGLAIASSYAIETRGELLRASVDVRRSEGYCYDGAGRKRKRAVEESVSVSVHALQEVEDEAGDGSGGKCLRWVQGVERSLGFDGRVMFLGQTASFAVDAARLGMGGGGGGGCAYFVHGDEKLRCVYRYSFGDEKLEMVTRLPKGWNVSPAYSWITPQPAIATTKEIRERVEALNRKESTAVKKLS